MIEEIKKGYQFFSADARHFQILFLSVFSIYGLTYLGWDFHIERYAILISTCLATQYFFEKITKAEKSSLKSALITSLGLSILLKANYGYIYMLAGFIAIGSKFIFRTDKKHFFNPANIGIVAVILITRQAWISPGQWGSSGVLFLLVGSLGMIVTTSVKKLDVSFAFLFAYLFLEFYRNIIFKNWPLDFFQHQATNGALLLFSFFMISDPVSTPNHSKARILWAVCVAGIAFYLSSYKFINGAPVWALVSLSPFTLVFDKIFKAEKFHWNNYLVSSVKTKIERA